MTDNKNEYTPDFEISNPEDKPDEPIPYRTSSPGGTPLLDALRPVVSMAVDHTPGHLVEEYLESIVRDNPKAFLDSLGIVVRFRYKDGGVLFELRENAPLVLHSKERRK